MAECWGCGVTDPQEDMMDYEGGHNIQGSMCEECFRAAPIEAQGVTGRWVAIGCGSATEEPDRLYLSGDDVDARDFEWEWVPYESDQIPIACGSKVSWRGA